MQRAGFHSLPGTDPPGHAAGPPSAPRPLAGDGPTVAPAVAAALDEIVTPLAPAPASPAAAATNGSRDDETGDVPGDERAAS